jgi:DivIVA domain-containing protein
VPLTPPDVAAKQFRVAFRGYDRDEVDAFLEEVESELARLLSTNERQRQSGAPSAPTPPSSATAGTEGQEAALRTLLLAQRTADEAIAEARAEAEQVRTAAREEADAALSAARAEAEATLTAARSEAQATLDASRTEAAGLDAQIAERTQAALGDLDVRRQRLEARIEELRAFEREYRTRLRAYLQGQLRELDSRSGPDDTGAGVPVGAGRAAVDRTTTASASNGARPDSSRADH